MTMAGPSREVICGDDQDAIQQAKQCLDGHDLQGTRLVIRLRRTD
jgi:hypothetical protein